jgi:hypothetical protein
MVGIPAELLLIDISVNHADCQLRSELHIRVRLPSDNRPDMGFADTHDPSADRMRSVLKHLFLLPMDFTDDQKISILLC